MAAAKSQRSARPSRASASADAVSIHVAGTRYSVVASAAAELGMSACSDESVSDCNVYWVDGPVTLEKYLDLKPYQKINHFPGMGEISRKDALARNIQRMRKENRGEYHFFPATWVLPADHNLLCQHTARLRRRRQRKTFIIKPHNGSMGNGIYLTQSPEAILPSERAIVQEYLEKPFLLDGYKCDLRVYVLVTSCNPLRVLVFKDGLVRLSTERYSPPTHSNLEQAFMHLTNYSLNRHSSSFDSDERDDHGSKRTLHSFMNLLHKTGHNVAELRAKIHDVIVKTLILAQPHLLHSCTVSRHGQLPNGKSQFFEILGFDILLDHTLQPWLLEVNRSPSFGTDANLDLHIKTAVIRDALQLANISHSERETELVSQRQASRKRLISSKVRGTGHAHSGAYDFLSEQADAAAERESRRAAAKEKLLQLRRERELEEFENEHKGGYVRVYPTSDPIRARLYSRLMEDSLNISSLGRSCSAQSTRSNASSAAGHSHSVKRRGSGCGQSVVQDMEELELLEILSQYEGDEGDGGPQRSQTVPWHSRFTRRPSTTTLQPLALHDCNPLGSMFEVMAARLHEEEQTQRTMVALREMAPFYPGKPQAEVQSVLERMREDFSSHEARMGSFWLWTLDNSRRKQLLAPVSEAVKSLLHTHWRRVDLRGLRLHQITTHLMSFLLSRRRGEGLWSTIPSGPGGKCTWEVVFKKKYDEALSLAELECCRRIVKLSQSLLFCAYHYHCLQPHPKHKPSKTLSSSKCPSLPRLQRSPASYATPSPLLPLHHPPPSSSSQPHFLSRISG